MILTTRKEDVMQLTNSVKNEMIHIVTEQLKHSTLQTASPDLIARHLLSYYNYDLQKVLDLAV
jgi:hypothetical protein